MKVQTVVEFSVNKVKDKDGKFVDDKRVENSKSESVTESGLDAVLQKQKMYVEDKLNQVQLDSFSVGAIHKIVITVYSTRRARGSSYIQTPEPYQNPKCGLINIKNDDSECFKWCMRYHQSEQVKNYDRLTVLKKLEDKYNYDNIEFPTTYDDIKQFEIDNEICINVYTIDIDNGLIKDYIGNIHFIKNDIVYLLRIESEDATKSHYVYIKTHPEIVKIKMFLLEVM